MNIYESICAVMADMGAVGKNSRNKDQGFMYRGIDAVMNALYPAMVKNKIFVVPEVQEQMREERTTAKGGKLLYSICRIKYTFYAEDGSNVQAVVVGEGMDSGDKATNKAMAVAFKYACFQTFCIPTEEMKNADPDAECHTLAANEEKQPEQTEKPKEFADDAKIAALMAACQQHGVEVDKILKLYKVGSFAELTVVKWKHAMDNIERIKGMDV